MSTTTIDQPKAKDPIFSIQTIGAETHVIADNGDDTMILATIANDVFNKYDSDALTTAFETCVTAIRSHDAFPTARNSEQRLAIDSVQPKSQDIIKHFGLRVG